MKALKSLLIVLTIAAGATIVTQSDTPATRKFADSPLVAPIIDHCVIAVGNCLVDEEG